MLLPSRCAACGRPDRRGACAGCVSLLEPPPPVAPPEGIDAIDAVCTYSGVGRALVGGLKFGGNRAAAPALGAAMGRLSSHRWGGDVDAVTWVPTTAAHRRRRGFDQAELLAGAVAREVGVPSRRLLRRARATDQTGGGRAARLALTDCAFRVVRAAPAHVLLVDDVCTTGASLAAAAASLRRAGASRVVAVTFAATPSPADAPSGRPGGADVSGTSLAPHRAHLTGSAARTPPTTYHRGALRPSPSAGRGP